MNYMFYICILFLLIHIRSEKKLEIKINDIIFKIYPI